MMFCVQIPDKNNKMPKIPTVEELLIENKKLKQILDEREQELILYSQKIHQASFDPLTNAINPFGFINIVIPELRKIIHTRGNFGLWWSDIDHFKNINDALGHQMGDVLLRAYFKKHTNREDELTLGLNVRKEGDELEQLILGRINPLHKSRRFFDLEGAVKIIIQNMNNDFQNLRENRGIYYRDLSKQVAQKDSRSNVTTKFIKGKTVTCSAGVSSYDEFLMEALFLCSPFIGIKYLHQLFEKYKKFNPKNAYPENKVLDFMDSSLEQNDIIVQDFINKIQGTEQFPNDELIFLFRNELSKESPFLDQYFKSLIYKRNMQNLVNYVMNEHEFAPFDDSKLYNGFCKNLIEKVKSNYNPEIGHTFKYNLVNHIISNYNPKQKIIKGLQNALMALTTSSRYADLLMSEIVSLNEDFTEEKGVEVLYSLIKHKAEERANKAKTLQGKNYVYLDDENGIIFNGVDYEPHKVSSFTPN